MFEIKNQENNTKARNGILITQHGKVESPFFMPVSTKGTVKLIDMKELEEMETECYISNGLLFYLRPGLETIEKFGGIHKFVNWKKSIFTDSGGFQILSNSFLQKITNEGVEFRNPFDGKKEFITPEKSIEIQNRLGSDVAMAFDDVRHVLKKEDFQEAQYRTIEWAKRCKKTHQNEKQMLFGINQGGTNEKLRELGAKKLTEIGFDGYAHGGLALGEPIEETKKVIKIAHKYFPQEKPKYLMGMGTPEHIIEMVDEGVDCFDSCFPTRTARHGTLYTKKGRIHITRNEYKEDETPIEEGCNCYACKRHSKAYIRHLFKGGEEQAKRLMSIHNTHFMQNFMKEIRTAIKEENFKKYKKEFLEQYQQKKQYDPK